VFKYLKDAFKQDITLFKRAVNHHIYNGFSLRIAFKHCLSLLWQDKNLFIHAIESEILYILNNIYDIIKNAIGKIGDITVVALSTAIHVIFLILHPFIYYTILGCGIITMIVFFIIKLCLKVSKNILKLIKSI
jgi:hypothetical protein